MATEPDLFESTLNLLLNRSAQIMLKQIAADTGIKYSWICALHNKRLKNEYSTPKCKKNLEKLNKYLVSKLKPFA